MEKKITIVVLGGIVTEVTSTFDPDIEIDIIDLDDEPERINEKSKEEINHILY